MFHPIIATTRPVIIVPTKVPTAALILLLIEYIPNNMAFGASSSPMSFVAMVSLSWNSFALSLSYLPFVMAKLRYRLYSLIPFKHASVPRVSN